MLFFYLFFFLFCFFILFIVILGETAIQSFSKAKLFLVYKNHRNFLFVKNFKKNTTNMIFSFLLLNYIFHAILSTLFTYISLSLNFPLVYTSIFLAFFLIALEISTKKIAISYPEKSLLELGYIYHILYIIFGKFSWYINLIVTKIMIKIFSFPEIKNEDEDELIYFSHQEDLFLKQMIKNILKIKEIYVEDIMIPKNDILTVTFNKKNLIMKNSLIEFINKGKKYIPIWNKKENAFIGVVNINKFCQFLINKKIKFKDTIEQVLFIPSSTNIYKMFKIFKERSQKFSFVINEYGETIGIITLKDILTEIVGNDVFNEQITVNNLNNNKIIILDGDTSLKELEKYISKDLSSENIYSINDLIINDYKSIPEEGKEFKYGNISFIVLDRASNKIEKVLLCIL